MTNNAIDQERVEFLRTRMASSPDKELLAAWPREDRRLPVVELEVEWVRFSTLNHRTRAEQIRAILQTGRSDLFTSDPLGTEAQEAQHRILRDQSGFEELKIDIAERGQQNHAVVTAEGVLINGNRRVAALRDLLNQENNLNCRYVRCLVLPEDATGAEMLELETELQVAKDFKQDYSWINQALLIEELCNKYDLDFERVAKMMHRKPKEVRQDFEKVQQVNQLVALSNGKWLHVDFEPNESAFDELAQYIRNKNASEQAAVRSVYFLGTLTGVNYRDLRKLRRSDATEFVSEELRGDDQLREILELAAHTGSSAEEPDLLNDVLGEEAESDLVSNVLEFVAQLDHETPLQLPSGGNVDVADVCDLVQRSITKAADEAEEERKDVNAVRAPLVRLDQASKELKRALMALPAARAISGWEESEFASKVREVRARLADLEDEA